MKRERGITKRNKEKSKAQCGRSPSVPRIDPSLPSHTCSVSVYAIYIPKRDTDVSVTPIPLADLPFRDILEARGGEGKRTREREKSRGQRNKSNLNASYQAL